MEETRKGGASLGVWAIAAMIGGCAVAFLWQALRAPEHANTPPNGRYQIVISPVARADTFLLDTQTGKTWTPTRYTDVVGEPTVWMPMEKADSVADLFRFGFKQKESSSKSD